MRSGTLRHIINIEQSVAGASDGMGNNRASWTAVASNLRASITPITSREVFAGEKIDTLATHSIVLRYWPGITSKMRVVFGARAFNVISVLNEEERNIMLTLVTQEQF